MYTQARQSSSAQCDLAKEDKNTLTRKNVDLFDELRKERKKCKRLELAVRKWVAVVDIWLKTGVAASPRESKRIYKQIVLALAKLEDEGEAATKKE